MAGKMVSARNYMEQNFQAFLVHLLQCQRPESAIIVSRERRSFQDMVTLMEELFAVYVDEQTARDELKAVEKLAKDNITYWCNVSITSYYEYNINRNGPSRRGELMRLAAL